MAQVPREPVDTPETVGFFDPTSCPGFGKEDLLMPSIPVDALEPGTVLAAPVHDADGRLLIPEGRPLTERQIGRLSAWGIETVEVVLEEEPEEEMELSPELLAQAEEIVAPRFALQPVDHRLVRETRALAVLQWATAESRRPSSSPPGPGGGVP